MNGKKRNVIKFYQEDYETVEDYINEFIYNHITP